MKSRRVAITGIGIVSAIGCGRTDFWSALSEGQSGVAPLADTSPGQRAPRLVAAVRDFAPKQFITSRHLRRMDSVSRMVVAASRMALADACMEPDTLRPERLAVVVGSAYGNVSESTAHLRRVFTRGATAASPMMFPNLVFNAPASYAGIELGQTGANLTVSQFEVSGEYAVVLGADLVGCGRAEVVVAGGGDELAEIVVQAHRQTRSLSSQRGGREWSSPYDADRNGVVLGEGSAMLVLEPLERALSRGADVYAELERGRIFSVPAAPYRWPADPTDACESLRSLAEPADDGATIDLVCGAASSSPHLDGLELDLFASLLGKRAERSWLTSIKGAVGEFGAAGALTTAAAALALREQSVPPLCSLREPDGRARLRMAAAQAQPASLERALVAGIARGGAAAAISLRRVQV